MVILFQITLLLTTIHATVESSLPEHPQKSYYKFQSSLSNIFQSNTPTPKSRRLPDLFAHNVHYSYPLRSAFIQGMQYAPLYASERKGPNDKDQGIKPTPTPRVPYNGTKYTSTYRVPKYKGHLEPRANSDTETENEDMKCYSPGLKVKGLPFVSRSPGYNVVYHNMPQVVHGDKTYKQSKAQEKIKYSKEATIKGLPKISYMRPYPLLQNLQLSGPTTMGSPLAIALNPIYSGKSQNRDRSIDSPKSKRQQASASSKLHRLHLNIARVYSPGQVPQKSPVFLDTYSLPEQTQTLLLPGSPLTNKNTIMLPVALDKASSYI